MMKSVLAVVALVWMDCGSGAARTAPGDAAAPRQAPCSSNAAGGRAGGLIGIAPDGTGTITSNRDCISLVGERSAARVGRTIEIDDAADGPASGPGLSTAASASYALSLVNVRPNWTRSALRGESDGLSVFVRQAHGDAAAMLSNVGVRSGFATTLESYTFAADADGRPLRAVRTQLGVVNPRDGGAFGLIVQAADGKNLTAGLRISSIGASNWKNYLEIVDPMGASVASIRGSDGVFVGAGLAPTADLRSDIGTPDHRYATTYTQVLHLAPITFARLPKCGSGEGEGALAMVSDAHAPVTAWGQAVSGGGTYRAFVKCDGTRWTAF